ncbi:phosphotransferase [Actinoplanes sp. CA-030573]|uniref:phosphotransferase n=1 Tax=Actinoplanes sp. CA-030573 TaxID=3239898 RepID=UPI003D8E5387
MSRVAAAFQLGEVVDCRPVTTGVMNQSWRLRTTIGTYAIKQLRDRPVADVRAAQALMPPLAARGFPVAEGSVARVDSDWYAAHAWLPGSHFRGSSFSLEACARFGEMIGRLHRELGSLCSPPPAAVPDSPPADARLALEKYATIAPVDDFDRLARREIAWRRELLLEHAAGRPPDREIAPGGWTHGDLQPFNLLTVGDRITGILDWDRLGVRPYGLEVVRTATICFSTGDQTGLDLGRAAAFAQGYRRRIPLTDAELADAADRRWWTLLTETWPLRRHYDEGDRSCDHLFTRRGAFLRWWTAHRAEVVAALTTPG